MRKRVLVTHQLPGDRFHDLSNHCDLNVWMGPGLMDAQSLAEELAGLYGDDFAPPPLLVDRAERNEEFV